MVVPGRLGWLSSEQVGTNPSCLEAVFFGFAFEPRSRSGLSPIRNQTEIARVYPNCGACQVYTPSICVQLPLHLSVDRLRRQLRRPRSGVLIRGELSYRGTLSSRFSCLAVLSEYDHTLTLKLYISIHYVLVLRRAQTLKSWDFKHTNPTSNIICKNVEYNSALFPPSSHTPAFYTYRTSIDPCTLDLKLGIDAKPRLLLLERVIHLWA